VDRRDPEAMKACYHPGARDTHWLFNGDASDFADYMLRALRGAEMTRHSVSCPIVEVKGDRAFSEARISILHRVRLRAGSFIDQHVVGRYLCLWQCREDTWKITYLHLVVDAAKDMIVPDTMGARVADSLGRPFPDDPVYAGFDVEQLRPEAYAGPEDYWARSLSGAFETRTRAQAP
jgi:hypothetical protein